MSLRRLFTGLLLAALTAASAAGCGGGGSPTAASLGLATESPSPTSTGVSKGDKVWLHAIHEGNLAEIAAGKLAEKKGTSESVKSVGKTLVEDHSKFDTQVRKVAEQLGVTLPDKLSDMDRQQIKALAKLSGKEFDQKWTAAMIKAHEGAIKATETEIQSGSSTEVTDLAKAALPTLQQHLADLKEAAGGQ